MGGRPFQTISFPLGANAPDHMGSAKWIFRIKWGILKVQPRYRDIFDMDSRAGAQWGSPGRSGPKSTISVIDWGRIFTVGKFLISQWVDAPCETISFTLGANVSDNMGAFHMDISPEVGNLISSRPKSRPF